MAERSQGDPMTDVVTRQLAAAVSPHSDDNITALQFVAQAFVLAHRHAPFRPSIEVGTRAGGSALLFLRLLAWIYGARPPLLVTIDPYGSKPSAHQGGARYGELYYQQMRRLLASYTYHAHLLVRSLDAFVWWAQLDVPYWQYGEEGHFRNFAFAYLDGDHDRETIMEELRHLYDVPLMAPQGLVVIDNVKEETAIIPSLQERYGCFLSPSGHAALVWRQHAC